MRNSNNEHHGHKDSSSQQGLQTKEIDIEDLYQQLSLAVNQRAIYEDQQEQLWQLIRQTHTKHRTEMCEITRALRENTEKLNQIITELCHYEKPHLAMNLADCYLQKEIERAQRIIKIWSRMIEEVDNGKAKLLDSEGHETTDTRSPKQYVQQITERLARLQDW